MGALIPERSTQIPLKLVGTAPLTRSPVPTCCYALPAPNPLPNRLAMPPVVRVVTAGTLNPAPSTPPALIWGPAEVRLKFTAGRPAALAVICTLPAEPRVTSTMATPEALVATEVALNVADPVVTLN